MAPFIAMGGWFGGFKHHYNFQSFQLSSKAATADEKEAKAFPAVTQKLTREECCTSDNTELAKKLVLLVNTLFNKVLGENENCVFYFYLKPNELFGQSNIFSHDEIAVYYKCVS